MRRGLVQAVAVLAVAVTTGCGVRPTGILSAGTKPVVGARSSAMTIYLVHGTTLRRVVRPGLPGHPYLGITQLGVPVTAQERREGLRTEVPPHKDVQVRQEGGEGMITVDVEGGDLRGGEPRHAWSRIARAQVACTAQTVPGVRRVMLAGLYDDARDGWVVATCEMFSDLLD